MRLSRSASASLSVLLGFLAAPCIGFVAFKQAVESFNQQYPHDGMNGLAGLFIGVIAAIIAGPLVGSGTWFVLKRSQHE